MFKRLAVFAAAAIFAATLGGGSAVAQQAAQTQGGIKRTVLQTNDLPGSKYEIVMAIAEIGPNVAFARHTHPGPETDYVLKGNLILDAEGRPEQSLKAGQTSFMPEGVVHWGKAGAKGAKVLAIYVVEKGKPLASPAPAK